MAFFQNQITETLGIVLDCVPLSNAQFKVTVEITEGEDDGETGIILEKEEFFTNDIVKIVKEETGNTPKYYLALVTRAEDLFQIGDETVTDIDGNVYTTVTIGTQTWMVENLKTTRFNDGTAIPLVTDNDIWANRDETPKMCFYNNDIAHKAKYGALYNFHAVDTGKLAPIGWHVPSDEEWQTLVDFLGGGEVAGTKLISPSDWKRFNSGEIINEYNFNALTGGCRSANDGAFDNLKGGGDWWSASSGGTKKAWSRYMYLPNCNVNRYDSSRVSGLSVRCLRG